MISLNTPAQVFEWLVELKRLDAQPGRQVALRNGWELFQLAEREGLVSAQQADQLAMLVATLHEDGWIT